MRTTLLTDPGVLADLRAALDGEDLSHRQRDAARQAVDAARRPTVTFASPRPGVFIVNGQQLDCRHRGMDAGYAAIASPGQDLVRAADFAAPEAANPDIVVRRSMRRAAEFIEPHCQPLAAVIHSLKVVKGFVRYDPRRSHARVICT